MNPQVSVIIPTYNAEKYLKESLTSVVSQSLKNIEILVLDDGSSDGTLRVASEFAQRDSRIKIFSLPHEGAGATRNKGLELAKGEYLSFLDADDIFDSHMLEKSYSRAQSHSADIVIFKYRETDISTGKIYHNRGFSSQALGVFKTGTTQLCLSTPSVWNKLFKRSFINEKNLFFQNIRTCNDFYFTKCAVAIAKNIQFINEELLTYRMNPSNISSSRYLYAENILNAGKELLSFINKNMPKSDLEPFYRMMFFHCTYEYEKIPSSENAITFIKQVNNFLPLRYKWKFFKRRVRHRIKTFIKNNCNLHK